MDTWRQTKTITVLTHLLTPWSGVLLEKLTGLQLVKKFPIFYGTRRFITAITSTRQVSLPWASLIQSILPHPTSRRSILILSSHLRLGLPKWSLSLRFPHQNPEDASPKNNCATHKVCLRVWSFNYISVTFKVLT